MGMFDTFYFDVPLYCPICGAEHKDVQSKSYGSNLKEFHVGSVVPESEKYEIREEDACCFDKKHDIALKKLFGEKTAYLPDLYWYLVIRDHKFVGAFPSERLADSVLPGIDIYYNKG